MAGLTTATKNAMLEAIPDLAGTIYASLHNNDPGDTGANEISGGTPTYARKAITWNAAANANLDSSNAPVFDVPATTLKFFGLWTASSGGTYIGGGALSVQETFAAQGTYTLSDADVNLT